MRAPQVSNRRPRRLDADIDEHDVRCKYATFLYVVSKEILLGATEMKRKQGL